MDQFYFESGYLEASYFGTLAIADSSVSLIAGVNAQGDIASVAGYYIPDYIAIDYFFGFVEASATITASFTSVSAVNKNVNVNAEFTVTFSQSGTISHIEGAELFAFGNAAITVQVARIRDNNTVASSVFSVATDFVVSRSADADANAVFSAIIAGLRSRDVLLDAQAAFSFVATATKRTDITQQLTSSSQLQAQGSRTRDIDLFAFGNGVMSGIASRLRDNHIDVSSVFDISALPLRIQSSTVSLTIDSTVNAVAARLRDGVIVSAVAFGLVCDATKNIGAQATVSSVLQTTTIANFVTQGRGEFVANSSLGSSRYLGSDRPKTISSGQGFSGSHLLGTAQRGGTYLGNLLAAPSWYYESAIRVEAITGTIPAFQDVVVLDMPLALFGGAPDGLKVVIRFIPSTATLQITTFVLNGTTTTNVVGNGQNTVAAFSLAVQWHNETVSVFIDGQRRNQYAYNNSRTKIDLASNVVFGKAGSQPDTYRYTTDYAWLALGNYSNSGSAAYQGYSSPLVNTEDTRFLYLFDGNGQETINLALTASAQLNSVSAVSAVIGRRTLAQAALSTASTVTAIVGTLESIDLVAGAGSTMVTDGQRVRFAASVQNCQTSITAVNERLRDVAIDTVSVTTTTAQGVRIQQSSVALSVTVAIQITALRVKQVTAALVTEASTARDYVEQDYYAPGYFETLQITASLAASAQANITAVVSVSAQGNLTKEIALVTTSQATTVAVAVRTAQAVVAKAVVATVVAVTDKIKLAQAQLVIESVLVASGTLSSEINLTALSLSTVITVASRKRDNSMLLQSQFTLFGDLTNTATNAEASITANTTVTVTGQVQRSLASVLAVISQTVTVGTRTAGAVISLNALVSTVTVAQDTNQGVVNLTVASSVSAIVGVRRQAQAHITSAFSPSIAVREVRLDDIVYVIPAEGYVYVIDGETRLFEIAGEARLLAITGETRLHKIEGESRIYTIE